MAWGESDIGAVRQNGIVVAGNHSNVWRKDALNNRIRRGHSRALERAEAQGRRTARLFLR